MWYRGACAGLAQGLPVRWLQRGARHFLQGFTHKQPGLTLIPEVAHRHEIRQPLICKGLASERERQTLTHVVHQCPTVFSETLSMPTEMLMGPLCPKTQAALVDTRVAALSEARVPTP